MNDELDRALEAARSTDHQTRMRAAILLGTIADASVAEELVNLLVAEPDPFVRETVTWAVVQNGEASVPHLHAALAGDSPSRAWVLHALSKIQHPSTPELVLPLVDDPLPQVAAKAWWVLGRMAVPEAAGLLTDRLGQQNDEDRKSDLTRALQFLGAPAVPLLGTKLGDPDPAVRRHAAEALVAIGDDSIGAVDELIRTAHSDERDLAVLAMEALVPLDDPRIDTLFETFRDGNNQWLATVADWFISERRELAARAARVEHRRPR